MMNVEKKQFRSAQNKEEIKNDIRKLRFAYTTELFDVGCQLFIQKWATIEPVFIMNFKNVYIDHDNGWYAGFVRKPPLANNCLESFNRYFKLHQTHYKRQNLSVFKDSMLTYVRQKSMEYTIDRPPLQTSVPIDDNLLMKGWEYSISKKTYVSMKSSDHVNFYLFAGANLEKITEEHVTRFKSQTFLNFDDFKKKAFVIYCVKFTSVITNWKNAQCTCASYSLNYMCKHILAIAYRLCILNPPDVALAAVEAPITEPAPRGRPRKSTPALVRD